MPYARSGASTASANTAFGMCRQASIGVFSVADALVKPANDTKAVSCCACRIDYEAVAFGASLPRGCNSYSLAPGGLGMNCRVASCFGELPALNVDFRVIFTGPEVYGFP